MPSTYWDPTAQALFGPADATSESAELSDSVPASEVRQAGAAEAGPSAAETVAVAPAAATVAAVNAVTITTLRYVPVFMTAPRCLRGCRMDPATAPPWSLAHS
jgi:hypothetical protein